MNDRRDDELFDEARLRRALRLDAAELPPRLAVGAIVLRAEAGRPVFAVASLASTALAGLAAAALVGLGFVALPALVPALASDALAAAIGIAGRLAVPLSGVLAVAQEPSVPIAALAALALAIAYEYSQRRERAHVVATS